MFQPVFEGSANEAAADNSNVNHDQELENLRIKVLFFINCFQELENLRIKVLFNINCFQELGNLRIWIIEM